LSTFCGVFMVESVKLMLRIFKFGVLLFYCFTVLFIATVWFIAKMQLLKRFTRYGYYAGEVKDIIIGRFTVFS